MNSEIEQNRKAWDKLAEGKSLFARPATDEECAAPLKTLDSRGWLPASVVGLKVLCLASGGGWQSILYAVAGARVTVVDLSGSMLDLDERESRRRGVTVHRVQTSMDDLSPLRDAEFDIVHQPVSTCYVRDIIAVYREVARVLKPGGLYISQHKQPTSAQISERDAKQRYVIGVSYYHEGPLPAVADQSYRETGTIEYLHRWGELIGGLCQSGFVLEDLVEPRRGDPKAPPGDFKHRGMFTPPYVRLKARRTGSDGPTTASASLWVPPSRGTGKV
ncbi:MAG: class I SAM-dependent methyltransferase [Planctomycetaceae bacterium]